MRDLYLVAKTWVRNASTTYIDSSVKFNQVAPHSDTRTFGTERHSQIGSFKGNITLNYPAMPS